MKKLLPIIFLFLVSNTTYSQDFIRNFLPKNYDIWGTAFIVDAFGDETDKVVYVYVCKGEFVSTEGSKEDIFVVTKFDLYEKELTIDIYKNNYELQTKFALDFSLMKDMDSGEIKTYRFQTPEWASLLVPIKEGEYRANPVKLILDGNGQEVKFKIPHITSYNSKKVGEYNFSIVSWDNSLREIWLR